MWRCMQISWNNQKEKKKNVRDVSKCRWTSTGNNSVTRNESPLKFNGVGFTHFEPMIEFGAELAVNDEV